MRDEPAASYFSAGNRHVVAEVRSPTATVRSARLVDPPDVAFDLRDEIGIAVHLNDGFSLARRSGGRVVEDVARFGEALVDVPGQRVDMSVRGECRIVQMSIPMIALSAGLEHLGGLSVDALRALRIDADPALVRLVCLALVEPDSEQDVVTEVVARLGGIWSGRPGSDVHRSGLAPARLRRVRDRVEADLSGVTLHAMAAEAALSPFHFARQFRRETGGAPWQYVVTRRLARAVGLLSTTDLPLGDVARLSGFTHASHLQRHLRARLGGPAGRVRDRLLP